MVLAMMIFACFALPAAALDKPAGIDLDIINELPPADGTAPAGAAEEENPLDRDFKIALEAFRDRDYATARDMWTELSDAGHGISMHNLAVLKWRGQGGPADKKAALELFRNAGEADVGPSLHALGVLALKGAGMPADAAEAVRYFEAASALGHTPSTYNLALANLRGIGGAGNKALGMELLDAAAESGLARAQYDLATLLYRGTYGPSDKIAARGWFERAADQGDPFACYNLALMQLAGEGGEKDVELAQLNLTEAAEMGAVPAQVRLAHMLASGADGVARDAVQAYAWFAIAGSLGAEGALENARRLARTLKQSQLKTAKQTAAAFTPRGPKKSADTANANTGNSDATAADDLLKTLQ